MADCSEVDGDDEGRVNQLTVWNELGNSTYTFAIPVVESKHEKSQTVRWEGAPSRGS